MSDHVTRSPVHGADELGAVLAVHQHPIDLTNQPPVDGAIRPEAECERPAPCADAREDVAAVDAYGARRLEAKVEELPPSSPPTRREQ